MLWSTNVLGCIPSYLMRPLGHRLDMRKGHVTDTTARKLKLEAVSSLSHLSRRHVHRVKSQNGWTRASSVMILESSVVNLR